MLAHDADRKLEAQLVARAKADPVMRLLTGIPGVGPLTAHAIAFTAKNLAQMPISAISSHSLSI